MKQRKTLGTITSSLGVILSRRREPQLLKRIFACLLLGVLCVTVSMAQSGPEMGKTYKITGITLTSYGPYVALPSHAFNSNAKSVKLSLTGSAVLKTGIMKSSVYEFTDAMESSYGDGNVSGVCLNLSGDYVTAAISGKLLVGAGNGTKDYTVYVTNYASEDGAANDTGVGVTADADNVIDANNPGTTGGETEGETGGESGNTPALGFADLGKGGLFQQLDQAYSYTGNASTMVAGAVVTITSNSGNLVWYKNKSDYTGYNSGVKSYTLTNDDITSLASNNYTLYFATWDGEDISNITLSSGGNTGGEGGGGTAGMTLVQKIEAKAQLTDVPTLYITVPDAEGKLINKVLDEKKEYHTATIQLVDKTEGGLTEFTDQVMIKVRGNSTAKENKKPYRLKFAKEIKDANGAVIANCQKHDMLGKGYSKRNWALLANYLDPAMVRNALTNKIGELVGMPFRPGYKFADVVINGEYRGTYQITDQIEAGTNRVDVNEDTGWYLESSRGDMIEEPSVGSDGLMMSIKNPEPETDADVAALKTEIQDWFKPVDDLFCINNGSFELSAFIDPNSGWRKYWDEESLVNFYIGINLTGDYDGFMTVKMYRDLNKKLKFGPLWDKDLAFGNYSADNGTKLAEDQQTGSYFTSYVKRLWLDPLFVKKVHDKLNTLIANGLIKTLKDNVDELVELTAKTEELNRPLWGIGASWTQSFSSREAAVKQLKDYLDQHIKWFQGTINDRYTTLGGDDIVDNSIPGDDFNDGAGGDEPTSTFEYTTATGGHKIPASAFCSNATKVEVTFTVSNDEDFWGFYGFNGSQWSANSFTNVRKTKTIVIEDAESIAKIIKNGITFELQSNGEMGSLTVDVVNTIPEVPDVPTRQQLTNLPTIYLDAEVGNEWSGATLEVFDADNKLGQGTAWTKTTTDVYVQFQGSGDKNKDSYRLKFETKTQLLSSGKFKQWVLLANDDDPTMMRNALAKEMGDALGLPFTPGYQFVDLYVNDDYMGTYQVTDRIKVESGRALVTGGNKDLDWHVRLNDAGEYNEDNPTYYIAGTTSMPYIIPKNPDPKDDETTWDSTLKSDMTTYFNNVFTKDASGKYTAFADNVDHQQLIEWYIAQEMLCVYKGFSSIEAYRSVNATDKNLHIGVLWDSEKAFGNTGEAPAISMADLNTASSYNGLMTNYAAYDVMKNIFTQLWQERWFANGVNNLWKEKHEAMLAALKTKATALKTELADSWTKNATQWDITGEQATSINAMTAWLTERDAYLTKKFAALAAAVPCEVHTYENHNYIEQTNGTYLIGCDVCGAIKADSETYYKFTVYPESATTTEVIATSWQPSAEHPNSYATVKITPSGAEADIDGYNIVNLTKDANGDKTCADFRLTDGHPYYGDDGFVAAKASYSRNISNEWGTICLPFKTQSASTDYADFYHLGSVKSDNENNASTLVFTPIQPEIEGNASAFIPVAFKATPKAKQEGKIVIEATNVSVKKTTGKSFIPTKSTVPEWTLIGTMEQKVINNVKTDLAPGEELYYISQNKFWHATGQYTSNPFRAYFICKPSTPAAAAKSFSIGVEDDFTTSVASMTGDALAIFIDHGAITLSSGKDTDVRIYTVSGALVEATSVAAGTTKTVSIPAGLYVVNGTKVTVK